MEIALRNQGDVAIRTIYCLRISFDKKKFEFKPAFLHRSEAHYGESSWIVDPWPVIPT
jgi:hypothetical protein